MTWKWRFADDVLVIGGTVPSTFGTSAACGGSELSMVKIGGVPAH